MHPDEAAFLKAIWAAPADDAPRLIFADWLQERNFEKRAKIQRGIVKLMNEAKGIWVNKTQLKLAPVVMLCRKRWWKIKPDGRLQMVDHRVSFNIEGLYLTRFYSKVR